MVNFQHLNPKLSPLFHSLPTLSYKHNLQKLPKIHFPCRPFGAPFRPVEEFTCLELDPFSGAFEVILGRLIRTPSLCRAVEVFWAHPMGRRPRGHALNRCRYYTSHLLRALFQILQVELRGRGSIGRTLALTHSM